MQLREALRASSKSEAEHPVLWGYAPATVAASPDGGYHASSYRHEGEWDDVDFATIEEVEAYVEDVEGWAPVR